MGEIRRLTCFASRYEDEFVKAVVGHAEETIAFQRQLKQKELDAMRVRDRELDSLFERLYKDICYKGGKSKSPQI